VAKAIESRQWSAPFHFQWRCAILQSRFYLVFSNVNLNNVTTYSPNDIIYTVEWNKIIIDYEMTLTISKTLIRNIESFESIYNLIPPPPEKEKKKVFI
jgi:hypothetical protein